METTYTGGEMDWRIEEAKKQERERIIAWGLEICPHWSEGKTKEVGVLKRDCSLCWQALKEEKE